MFTLGLDLDGVCGDYIGAFRHYVSRYTNVPEGDIPDPAKWDLVEAGWPFENQEEFFKCHADAVHDGIFRSMEPMPGVSEALWEISEAEVHIRIITHRLFIKRLHMISTADTVGWLDRHNIPYRDLCFTAHKAQVDADLYIDDGPNNIATLQSNGFDVLIFDAPYNKNMSGDRVFNWAQAKDLILERKANAQT